MLKKIEEKIFWTRNDEINKRVLKIVNYAERNDHNKFTTDEKFLIMTRAMDMFVSNNVNRRNEMKRESKTIRDHINKLNQITWKKK